jgi:EAL domain-containing protein (putative c-di-GMP-specific phosphodiesterase class I)/FixJ family two-component response regulator
MENIIKKTKNYNVLLVDDEEEIREGMKTLLKKFFNNVDVAVDGKDGLSKYLKNNNYEIVITDLTMPKMNGMELIDEIKRLNPFQKIIILTAHQGKENLLDAISSQADGYLIKPFNIDNFKKIILKISNYIEMEKLNENYKNSLEEVVIKKSEELKDFFFKDELTGLYNYNKLKEDLKSIDKDIYFVGIDISNFRKINSIFGIESGNLVLKKTAEILNNIFPKASIYRLQDASFSYLFLEDTNIQHILEILNNKLSKFTVTIHSIEMKFSFKVLAVSGKDDVLSKYNLVSSFIKDRGIKQIYQYFDGKIDYIKKSQEDRLFWVNKSLKAVNNSDIEPFFQAIVDNKTKKIVKYEVLARLKDGNEYVSPYFFIEPSKEAGILVLITKMIIEKSFKKIANTNLQISINITVYDLEEGYLEEFLEKNLKENNIKSNQITIEILEGIESESSDEHLNQLIRLKEKGFVIAIDDFGTGYSNFQRVYQIQPDFIKIDGIYIKDINENENSLKITKAIINFAKSIGAKTIAEFVENEKIYKKVTELGIDYSQGYYFSKPSLEIKEKI